VNKRRIMSNFKTYEQQVQYFVEVCHKLSRCMFVTSHGGNLAWKLEEDLILLSPTKVNKGDIKADDLVFIDFSGNRVEGKQTPTGETPMYMNFFKERSDINSVIHCHPPYTGAFAITGGQNLLMRPIFPETSIEIGPVPVVPYAEPLTQELADNFLPFLQKYNAFLMENHGLVIMSRGDIKWTMLLTEELEMSSISILHALSFGRVKEIPKDGVLNLDRTMQTRKLPLPGAPGVNKSLVNLYYST
jgi:L-fuculose-phosphate aldolase